MDILNINAKTDADAFNTLKLILNSDIEIYSHIYDILYDLFGYVELVSVYRSSNYDGLDIQDRHIYLSFYMNEIQHGDYTIKVNWKDNKKLLKQITRDLRRFNNTTSKYLPNGIQAFEDTASTFKIGIPEVLMVDVIENLKKTGWKYVVR